MNKGLLSLGISFLLLIGSNSSVLAEELDKPKQKFLVKLIWIELKQGSPPRVNVSKIYTYANSQAGMTVKSTGSPSYFSYKVTPSLTEEGKILINYLIEEKKGEVKSGNLVLRDGGIKVVKGSFIGDKSVSIILISAERVNK